MRTKNNRTPAELADALHTLRLLVKEVGGNYVASLQSEVARLQQAVRLCRADVTPNRKHRQQMAVMLKWITNLDIKPEKGRRRDLKELDKLISRLSDVADNW